jgi:phosphoribosyl-AMP cyclohydrolase
MTTAFADPKSLTHEELEEGTAFAPRFDDKGLITVVTVEAGSKDVLMVAHMNAEALALTLETGIAHYWSRSRNSLWKKGETSGELQEVVEITTDCDQDCLVMSVRQTGRGAACHCRTARPVSKTPACPICSTPRRSTAAEAACLRRLRPPSPAPGCGSAARTGRP